MSAAGMERDQQDSAMGHPSSPSLALSLSRPAILPHVHEDEPLYVIIRLCVDSNDQWALSSGPPPDHPAIQNPEARIQNSERPPVHLGLILDASGSMYRIVLEGRERDQWREVGERRGDLKRGRVDGREGWLWSGRTLAELQSQHRTPMQAALRALVRAGERLRTEDRLQVIAFADRARPLVNAHAADRAVQIREAVALLSQGVETSGLGDGTRLADALRLALGGAIGDRPSAAGEVSSSPAAPDGRWPTPDGPGAARLLLVSDGLLEDRVACGAWVERIAEAGIPLCCIGVGDQFDEEWLMAAADATRGRFRYAPTSDALEHAVAEELDRLETLFARRLTLELRPQNGALFQDLCQVSPELSALHRMETDGAVHRFGLGDFSRGQEALFVVELALPSLPSGRHPVLTAGLMAESPRGEPLPASSAQAIVAATADLDSELGDPADLEAVAAVHAYRAERRAQRALRRGQIREATRHLRDTRQIVEQLGRSELAAELEAQADTLESGTRLSPEGVKRIKAGTRQLMT